MSSWLIVITALWTYPVIGFILIWLTRNKPASRRKILYILCISSGLALLGYFCDVSFTLSLLDWIIISGIYLLLSFLLWWAFLQQGMFLKVAGFLAMLFVFGIGYFSGTVGILGVGFIVAEKSTDTEQWLGNGIIYKETTLGNAVSHYRGKRVEICRTISWFPVLEWVDQKKEYYNLVTYGNKLDLDYRAGENKMILSVSKDMAGKSEERVWVDTLDIK